MTGHGRMSLQNICFKSFFMANSRSKTHCQTCIFFVANFRTVPVFFRFEVG